MDYEAEDKAALCRATFALACEEAKAAGGMTARTYGGEIPLDELLADVPTPWARDGWIFEPACCPDPDCGEAGRIGAIMERGGNYPGVSFQVYR